MMQRRFPRSLAALDGMFTFVDEALAAEGVSPDRAADVGLVLEELFTNQVKYRPEGQHPFEVSIGRDGALLTMVLRDRGVAPFDPTRAPEPDLARPIAERRAGGLGLLLVRRIAEQFRYEHQDGDSVLTVTFRMEP